MARVIGEASNLIQHLNAAAGVVVDRTNTWPNVENTCANVDPNRDAANFVIIESSGAMRPATVIERMAYDMNRAKDVNRELLRYAAYLSTDVLSLLVDIDEYGYFKAFEMWASAGQFQNAPNLSFMAGHIFDYHQLADHVDDYRHDRLPVTFRLRPELIAGSARGSSATPLWRQMNRGDPVKGPPERWRWISSRRVWLIVALALVVLAVVAMYKAR
jgi:hypothetical protein